MSKETIVRGCEVEHILTGIKGIASNRSETLSGSIQFSVERKGLNKEGEPFKEEYYDLGHLKRIGDGIISQTIESCETDISLGDKVKDLSGFEGSAIERVDFFNGCVSFNVIPKAKDKNTFPESKYLACQYLTKVSTPKKKTPSSRTGGSPSHAPTSSRH